MKHGLKMRKLQRTSSHRYALLRNLVSALLHHEMIKTTVPKAKEAARMAEKVITHGKKGTLISRSKAQAFLMPAHTIGSQSFKQAQQPADIAFTIDSDPENYEPKTSLLPKVFGELAQRYAERPGGYTRIQRYGKRPGDNAPMAVLSLVDGPRDLKFEMTARAVAKETLFVRDGQVDASRLPQRTRRNMERVLKFRGEEGADKFNELRKDFAYRLRAEGEASHESLGHHREAPRTPLKFRQPSFAKPMHGRKVHAGERLPGVPATYTGLGIARGPLGKKYKPFKQAFAGESSKIDELD